VADPLQAARAYVDEVFKGLDLSSVTARTAKDRCDAALETLVANCTLITTHERPRQERVRQQRAQASATKAGEAARLAAEKQARIERRKVFQP
jgi:hypothetical protein